MIHLWYFQGSVMSCEYLLLNGAKINCQDVDGKTPLYLATELGDDIPTKHLNGCSIFNNLSTITYNNLLFSGHTAQVCLLLKHHADQHIEDEGGVKPLSIAVKEANADIVTL